MNSLSQIRKARRKAELRASRISAAFDYALLAILLAVLLCGGIATVESIIAIDAQNGLTVSQSLDAWGL